MPGYTDSPLGAFLASLGQGLPALGQAHRAREIQDTQLAAQAAEAASRLKTEGLQQQIAQANVDQIPANSAWQKFERADKVDPLMSVVLQRPLLQQAGVDLPEGYMPPDKQMAIQRSQEMMKMLGTINGPQSAPAQAAPPSSMMAGETKLPSPAPQSTTPGAPGGIQLTPTEKFRFLSSGQFPSNTAQEAADMETAKKNASIAADRASGKLPESDAKFVQDAMSYYNNLQNVTQLLQNPAVQKNGMAGMWMEKQKYNLGIANNAPYDQIIPAADLGKQQVLSDMAGGIRNAKVRAEIGAHLASSDQSPKAMQQRIENILKYYPYMVYSKYASRGVQMPDQVAQGLGFQNAAAVKAMADQLDSAKPDIAAVSTTPNASVGTGSAAPQGALLQRYADQFFGGDLNAARQAAAASIANRK